MRERAARGGPRKRRELGDWDGRCTLAVPDACRQRRPRRHFSPWRRHATACFSARERAGPHQGQFGEPSRFARVAVRGDAVSTVLATRTSTCAEAVVLGELGGDGLGMRGSARWARGRLGGVASSREAREADAGSRVGAKTMTARHLANAAQGPGLDRPRACRRDAFVPHRQPASGHGGWRPVASGAWRLARWATPLDLAMGLRPRWNGEGWRRVERADRVLRMGAPRW